jgi:hypothetical protein
MGRRVLFLGALALAITGLLFGLGIGRGGQSAQAAVSRAAQRTLDTGSSRFDMTISGAGVPANVAGRPVMEGELDYRAHVGVFRIGLGTTGEQVILDGDAMYLKMPQETSWVRFDSPLQSAVFEPQLQALRDPAALLDFLRAGSSDVHQDGSETIDGVQTARYAGTLDLNRVVAGAPADERDQWKRELALVGQFESTSIPYTIWVDDHGVARRLRVQDTSTDTDVTGGQKMDTTIDFYDFGIEVNPTLPAPADVLTPEQFQQQMSSTVTGATITATATASASASGIVEPKSGETAKSVTFTDTFTNGGR